MEAKIKETLEKQLELLSERSTNAETTEDLCKLSEAMVSVSNALFLSGCK